MTKKPPAVDVKYVRQQLRTAASGIRAMLRAATNYEALELLLTATINAGVNAGLDYHTARRAVGGAPAALVAARLRARSESK